MLTPCDAFPRRAEQCELWRDDVRDIVGLTQRKMARTSVFDSCCTSGDAPDFGVLDVIQLFKSQKLRIAI